MFAEGHAAMGRCPLRAAGGHAAIGECPLMFAGGHAAIGRCLLRFVGGHAMVGNCFSVFRCSDYPMSERLSSSCFFVFLCLKAL